MAEKTTFDLYAVNLATYPGPYPEENPHTVRMATLDVWDAEMESARISAFSAPMRVVAGNVSDYYLLSLRELVDGPLIGWQGCKAHLTRNNELLGWLPLSWYVGEATDWTTGLARFQQPLQPGPGRTWVPGPVWLLSARRGQ